MELINKCPSVDSSLQIGGSRDIVNKSIVNKTVPYWYNYNHNL